MKIDLIKQLQTDFEGRVRNAEGGPDFWLARDLQILLDYTDWRNFEGVIARAKDACSKSGQRVEDHFVDTTSMIEAGKGAQREIADIACTRYAAYLIAMNGDPKNPRIAFAQTYFVVQTREQEIIASRIADVERLGARAKLSASETELSGMLMDRLGDGARVARVRSKGDKALYGITTQEMKNRLNVPEGRPLADFLPTITIKAKDFANEVTATVVKKDSVGGEEDITRVHVKSNTDVRKMLTDRGIIPERLPAAEDTKKVERRLASDGKKLARATGKLPPTPPPNGAN